MGLFSNRKQFRNLENNPLDMRIKIIEKVGECGSNIHRSLTAYQNVASEMATTLGVLAREVEKFYDKNSKFKETVTQLTGYIRAHSECVKEKAERLRELVAAAKCIEAPFSMVKILVEAFLEDRDNYIHYSTKLEELQSEKIKKEGTGAKVSKKDTERLVRNEQKLSAATSSYAVSLKKFKVESENLMEKRLRIMNPVLVELFKTEFQSIQDSARCFLNIERIDQVLLDFSGIDEYKATVLPALDTKMGEVKDFEDLGSGDKRFSSINVSSIEQSQISLQTNVPKKDPPVAQPELQKPTAAPQGFEQTPQPTAERQARPSVQPIQVHPQSIHVAPRQPVAGGRASKNGSDSSQSHTPNQKSPIAGRFDFGNAVVAQAQPSQQQQFDIAVSQPRRSSVQNSDFLFDSYAPSRQSVPLQLQPQAPQPSAQQPLPQQAPSQAPQMQMIGQPQPMMPEPIAQQHFGQNLQMPGRQQQLPAQNPNLIGGYDLDDLMGAQNSRQSQNFMTNPSLHPQQQQAPQQQQQHQQLQLQNNPAAYGSLPAQRTGLQNTPPQPMQNPAIHQNAYMQSHLQGVQQASLGQNPQVSDFDNFDNQFATAGQRRTQAPAPQPQVVAPAQPQPQPQPQRLPEPAISNQDPFGGFNFDFGAQSAQTGFSNEFFGGSGAQASSDVFEFKASSRQKPQSQSRATPDFNNFFGDNGQQQAQQPGLQQGFGFGSLPQQQLPQPQPVSRPQQMSLAPMQMNPAQDFSLGLGAGQARLPQSQASNNLTAEFAFPAQNSSTGQQLQQTAPQNKPQDKYSAFDDIMLSGAPQQSGLDLGGTGMQLSNQMTFGNSHSGMQLPQMQSAQQGMLGYQSQPGPMPHPQAQGFHQSAQQQQQQPSFDAFQFAAQQSMAPNSLQQTGNPAPAQTQQQPQLSAEQKQAINAQLSALEDLLI